MEYAEVVLICTRAIQNTGKHNETTKFCYDRFAFNLGTQTKKLWETKLKTHRYFPLTQKSANNSACLSTVSIAFCCLSGG